MPLAMTLENLDNVEDSIKPLYIEKDGKFHLDVEGHHDKNDDPNRIPKARLDQEIEKRKASDAALKEVADGFIESIPEDMRDLVLDLPPAQKIKWVQQANQKGLFDSRSKDPLDSTRPGDKSPTDFKDMTPTQIMAAGYQTK